MAYRNYVTVHGDAGTRLGKTGLKPVVENINAHIREADEIGADGKTVWKIPYDACRVATHLGSPVIRVEVDQAWQVRLAQKVIRRFLTDTGWKWHSDMTAAYRRAYIGR